MNIQDIKNLYSEANLYSIPSLIKDIESSVTVEVNQRDRFISCDHMRRIYAVRSKHLKRKKSAHGKQLSISVTEFHKNLEKHHDKNGTFISISTTEEYEYKLFVLQGSNHLIGCMKTISQLEVSPERWAEIWEQGV